MQIGDVFIFEHREIGVHVGADEVKIHVVCSGIVCRMITVDDTDDIIYMVARENLKLIVLQKHRLRVGEVEQDYVVVVFIVDYVLGYSDIEVARNREHSEEALDQKQCREEARILPPVELYAFERDFQIIAHIDKEFAQDITSVQNKNPINNRLLQ